jgi:hypothetical protein
MARRSSHWHEIESVDLVRRGPWYVSASTDIVLQVHRGVVFPTGLASPLADQIELWFTVDDGTLTFFERVPGVESWSQHVAQREAIKRRRAAPKTRPAWMDSRRA